MNTVRRRRALAVACLAVASLPLAVGRAAATHEEPTAPNGSGALDACYGATSGQPVGTGTCRGAEQATRDVAQLCRFPRAVGAPTPEAACSALDGRSYSPEAMTHYQASWVHRALGLQARLDDREPLRLALFPATHNSFNSAAYRPTLTNLDHNQVASLTDQLDMDMRSVELDVHWFPSPFADPGDGGRAAVLCHGQTQNAGPIKVHIGCSADRPLSDGLREIANWLDAHPGEIVLLYLENQLDDDPVAHAAAARAIETELDGRVLRPATTCAPLPTEKSEERIGEDGKQVVIVGNCGAGGAWGSWVHDRSIPNGVWTEAKSDVGDDFSCPSTGYGSTFQRFYEDSTWVSFMAEPTGLGSPGEITPDETAAMVACGVNLFGFDQLVPGDPRLARLVWSWAENEPSAGGKAAYQGSDGRFRSSGKGAPRRFACRDASGWHVTTASGRWQLGAKTCAAEFPGSDFTVPPTAVENAALRAVADAAGAAEVWLDYSIHGGTWVPS